MTTLTQTTEIVNFRNQPLITLKVGEIIYTAIRPIVEGMGIEWSTQLQKLKRNMAKFNCVHMNTVAEDGKIREMLCIPIKKLNGWLFSINPEKIKDMKVKQDVIEYQEECFEVLHDYWHKGEAINPRRICISESQRKTLANAVRSRCRDNSLHYSTVWRAVKEHFDVEVYEHILASDFDNALSLIKSIQLPATQPQNSDFNINEYLNHKSNISMQYIFELENTVYKLTGNYPQAPLDKESIAKHLIGYCLNNQKAELHFGTSGIEFKLLPVNSITTTMDKIPNLIRNTMLSKQELDNIIQASAKKLSYNKI